MSQTWKLGYVNCEEFGGQKAPIQENYHWLLLSSSPDGAEEVIMPLTPVWNFWLAEKGSGNEYTIQELRGPTSGQEKERDYQVYLTAWI